MRWRFGLIIIFSGLGLLFTHWPESWRPFLETVYGDTIYPLLQSLFSWVPTIEDYAVSDFLWVIIPSTFLLRLILLLRQSLINRYLTMVLETGLWLSAGYFILMLSWGLNYQRESLYQQLTEEGFTRQLVDGHWNFALEQTQTVINQLPADFHACDWQLPSNAKSRPSALAHSAMALADLTIVPPRDIRFSAWSTAYTGLGVAGVYIPITGEPTVNAKGFPLSLPFTMTHEYAHWAHYAHEYDADIIAYWSLWLSPDPVWQFAAWLEWWMSIKAPKPIQEKYPATLQVSMHCYNDFLRKQPRWNIRHSFWKVYETNLKNQGVSEGLRSYKMGEAMALSSFQDWLYKKANR